MAIVINNKAVVATISKERDRLTIYIPRQAYSFLKHKQKVIIKPFNYKERVEK